MSELFDEEAHEPEPARPARRARALVITGAALVLGFFALTTFASVYTDRLWFVEVGYGQVFTTMLWTRIVLFFVFGLLMAGVVAANMYLAYRFRPLFRMVGGDGSVDRYRDAVTPIRTWLLAGVATVVGVFAGTSAVGQWRAYLLWRNAEPFGQQDAYFGKDIGFYVFRLPWWHYLVDYLMAVTLVALLVTAVVHYLYGGIRLQVPHDRLSGAAQVQLSALLGSFVLAKAVDYYLDRYDLVTNDNPLFTGMNYTANNALLPARNILLGIAVICAVLFFLNIWRRTWQLPSVGLALLAISAVLLGMIWPAIVQQFQVKPTEADKEEAYIQANIDATRMAYGIDGVAVENYGRSQQGDAAARALASQLTQVPVVDPKQVFQTFEQRQQPRIYYSVPPVLDVDRYTIDGVDQPLVLGVRELDQKDVADRNWTNLHTVYTHGEGIIAAYADRVSESEDNGRMVWAEGITPESKNIFSLDPDLEQRIYYGEMSPTYSVVGKASEGAADVELGLGIGEGDPENTEEQVEEDSKTTYDGAGGVSIGGNLRQLLYAIKFGEPNFLLSGRVNENSKVLYNRQPVDRVKAVAPWLTVDGDAYPAVIDGRIQWIIDGYTTTDRYPNSQRESFEAMTDDSLRQDTGLQTIPTDEINYMRSAVKATVDAYDGTVRLYQWDEEDPILRTWMKAFPGSVEPRSEIPDALMPHLRYPEDLFKVQRYQLAKYHVTDASDFYQGNDRWEVPQDPEVGNSLQPPYRLFTRTGPDGASTWSLTSVFVPRGKGNLASFVSVDSDATSEDFGRIRVLQLTDPNAAGPGQAANEMQQDDEVISKLTAFRVQGATPPVFGNLLTVPVANGLVQIQPVYAVRTNAASSFPILQFVIVRYGSYVGIGSNLTKALEDALGVTNAGAGGGNGKGDGQGAGEPAGTLDEQISAALSRADAAFKAAEEAQADGDTVEWARQYEIAKKEIARAVRLAKQRDAEGGAESDGESGEQPTDEPSEPADPSASPTG